MMTLREACERDLPALAAIEQACFSDPWSEGALRAHLASPAARTLVAEEGDCLLGALLLSVAGDEGEVYRLGVLPRARRRGLGRALMRGGLALWRAAGVRHLYLDVRAGNTPAIALYRSLGFTECGRRAGYYRAPREDAVLMERELICDEIPGN